MAWRFDTGTLRRIYLQTAISLRSLGVGPFALQAFSAVIQAIDLVVLAQSRNPVRLPVPGGGHRQLVASAATLRGGHWAQKLLGRDIQTSVKPHQPSETLARR